MQRYDDVTTAPSRRPGVRSAAESTAAGQTSVDREPPSRPNDSASRAPFTAPALEPLGEWSALTLQQSVSIGPGGDL